MTALERLAAAMGRFGEVRRDEPMWRHTTFGVGGPADVYVIVRDAESLAAVARAAKDAGVSVFVLGSGSNVVVSDAGIRGVVIENRARREVADESGYRWLVESGVSFAGFARKSCRKGLAGLTWAVGIPGTIGGAVVYNAGAYGGCLADVLVRARLTTDDGDAWFDATELGLEYRGSVLRKHPGEVVLEAELQLQPGDPGELMERVAEFDRRRLAAQPRGRNAGSMFKNPPERPAWKLIDEVGLRGARRGDAGISELHSNFFVNLGTAKAADVHWLVTEAERRVKEQFGIELQREVGFVGEW